MKYIVCEKQGESTDHKHWQVFKHQHQEYEAGEAALPSVFVCDTDTEQGAKLIAGALNLQQDAFELAFGDGAISKDYSNEEVLIRLREFSVDALSFQNLRERIDSGRVKLVDVGVLLEGKEQRWEK